MPTVKPRQFTSWSFTRWSDFNRCPAYANWKHLEKRPEGPKNAAMQRGIDIGKKAEDYTLGKLRTLPTELKLFKDEFKHLRQVKAAAEENWGFDKNWTPCSPTDWDNCVLRVKMDTHHVIEDTTLVVIDHKTGRYSDYKVETYKLQLELYTLAGFKKMPAVQNVSSQLWYLDEGLIYPPAEEAVPVPRKEEKRLQKIWDARSAKMLNATSFKPTPNHGCQWCPYRKENGGPCKY